jgi:hypothetical protein
VTKAFSSDVTLQIIGLPQASRPLFIQHRCLHRGQDRARSPYRRRLRRRLGPTRGK